MIVFSSCRSRRVLSRVDARAHEAETPSVARGADVHPIHDVSHAESKVGIRPSGRSTHAEMPECTWAPQARRADDAAVHVESQTPLNVQSHEHDIGTFGLLLHGTIDL